MIFSFFSCTDLLGFPGHSDGKESARKVGDLGSIPGLGGSPGGGHGNPLQHSCLENPHRPRSLAGCSPELYHQACWTLCSDTKEVSTELFGLSQSWDSWLRRRELCRVEYQTSSPLWGSGPPVFSFVAQPQVSIWTSNCKAHGPNFTSQATTIPSEGFQK